MSVEFQKANSVQGQEVGRSKRCECKHVLLLLFQPSFLLCLSLHRSSHSPLPVFLELYSRWCNSKQLWWQRHKGPTWTPWQPSLRRKCNKWLHSMSTGWWPLLWRHPQVHTRTNYTNSSHTHRHRGFISHFSMLAWNIFIISRIIEAACTIIIQDISAFALVTFLRCRLQEVDGANVELMEAESRVPSEAWLEKDVLNSLTLIGTTV